MSSIGTGAMTLSAEDYQEREEKGFSYSLIHACDCGCLQYMDGGVLCSPTTAGSDVS